MKKKALHQTHIVSLLPSPPSPPSQLMSNMDSQAVPLFPNIHHNFTPHPEQQHHHHHHLMLMQQQWFTGTSDIDTTTPELTLKKPRRKGHSNAAAVSGAGTPPCTECGKCFTSWKALFGHMRCHPERPYRGIKPPPGLSKQLSLLPPNTATFTADEYDVARSLIMLASGPRLLSCRCCIKGRCKGNKKKTLWKERVPNTISHDPKLSHYWDLNLPPPPVEDHLLLLLQPSSSSSNPNTNPIPNPNPALDLKLGI